MEQFSGFDVWRDAFLQSTVEIGTRIAAFVPHLVLAVFIIFVGWLIAQGAEVATGRLLRLFGIDTAARRLRVSHVLERAGVRVPLSEIVATSVYWVLLLSFMLFGVETLGVEAVSATLERLVQYIPQILGAVLILVLGFLSARFVGTVVTSGAAAAGFSGASRLGAVTRLAASTLVLVVALEQLGVATNIFIGPLTVLLGAAGLAAGLAFALGAYPIVNHILAGHFLKQSLPRDVFVEVDGRRGTVDRVGATETLFSNGEDSWSVPNARLLDMIVER